jgi:hypothetical protein
MQVTDTFATYFVAQGFRKARQKPQPFEDSRGAAGCVMNSLYTHGVRQTNSLNADLERLRNGENSASLLGLWNSLGLKGNRFQ